MHEDGVFWAAEMCDFTVHPFSLTNPGGTPPSQVESYVLPPFVHQNIPFVQNVHRFFVD